MIVYIDVVFLENLIMNYGILYTTFSIKRIKASKIKIFISSIIGATYSVLNFIPDMEFVNNVIIKIFVSIIMILIVLKDRKLKKTIEILLVFYFVSFSMGGVAFAFALIGKKDIYTYNNGVIIEFPTLISLVALVIGICLIKKVFKNIKFFIKKSDIFYQIEIYIEEKKSSITAILDTGNMLKDPITQAPVIVVNKNSIKEIIPQELEKDMEKILGGDLLGRISNQNIAKRITVIPYSSIGNENGMIIGVKPDKIIIENKEIKNVVIGIYEKELSKQKKYEALFGLDLLLEEECKIWIW